MSGIRSVTDDEAEELWEHGWVKPPQLVSSELAGELLSRARVHMGPGGDQHAARSGTDTGNVFWNDRNEVAHDDDALSAVCLGPEMGANAQRLMRRNVGVLHTANMLAVKIGTQQGSSCASTQPTIFHQDALDLPIDRNDYVSFWIALDRVTRDMGGMRFVDRSHTLGMLGLVDLFETYPALSEMTAIDPVELAPGGCDRAHDVHDPRHPRERDGFSALGVDRRLHPRGRDVHGRLRLVPGHAGEAGGGAAPRRRPVRRHAAEGV
jgi:hypothetical protein